VKKVSTKNIEIEAQDPAAIFSNGQLSGSAVIRSVKLLSGLKGIFEDTHAFEKMDGEQIVYEVDAYMPVPEGTTGGLFFGLTHLYPGLVNNEYFMTKGHIHRIEDRAEFYWGLEGEGLLLLMDKNNATRSERMYPGSLHYIPGFTAHRVVNTGDIILRFGACWPSDSGHNYYMIEGAGLWKRVKNVNGKPKII
jgi:glucose-6-phosphate isomerase, archaeal